MIKAVLFDMDGVLVDSEKFINQAGVELFREKGYDVKPEDFTPFTGMGENRYLGGVAEKYNIPFDVKKDKARAYQIYGELVKGKLEALDGVHEFIDKCKKKNLRMAVATSADEVKMKINLRETGLKEDAFDALVNGLDVENRKPDPEIYLKAAKMIGVDPSSCLVVEDAVSGVKAAKAAGCNCLALTTSFSKNELDGADWFAETLASAPDECLNW
ncbi:MAG TPA: HAD-IA family hydrolase [Bacteroidales bacterium]|nr:HAD-IA family hydrolase [Bacteroidales bacterium]